MTASATPRPAAAITHHTHAGVPLSLGSAPAGVGVPAGVGDVCVGVGVDAAVRVKVDDEVSVTVARTVVDDASALLVGSRLDKDGGDAAVVFAGADVCAVRVADNDDRVDEPWIEGEREARTGWLPPHELSTTPAIITASASRRAPSVRGRLSSFICPPPGSSYDGRPCRADRHRPLRTSDAPDRPALPSRGFIRDG